MYRRLSEITTRQTRELTLCLDTSPITGSGSRDSRSRLVRRREAKLRSSGAIRRRKARSLRHFPLPPSPSGGSRGSSTSRGTCPSFGRSYRCESRTFRAFVS